MERRCTSLVKVVLEYQEEPLLSVTNVELNKQSLKAMYQYLESKNPQPSSLPPLPNLDPPPQMPQCYWCKGPIEFPSDFGEEENPLFQYEDVLDADIRTAMDSEKLTGFTWKDRRHPVKEFGSHLPETCVLSLVPIQFPYRRCVSCPVACLMEPGK
jgi:hypothetical protein